MFIVMCAVIVCVFCFCLRGSAPTNNNVNGAIQQVEQDVDRTRANIKEASNQNQQARESIERADFAIRNSTERARELQTEIRIISAELSRIIELNRLAQEQLEQAKSTSK